MADKLRSPAYALLRRQLIASRKSLGLTQSDLAVILGRSQSTVSAFESGTRYMDILDFLAWARAVKLDPHKLLDEIEAAGV